MPKTYVCHIVIPAKDLEKTAQFYEKVLSFEVKRHTPGPQYWFWSSGELDRGGAFDSGVKPVGEASGILIYFEVASINATLEMVKEAGGVVLRGRDEISPEFGWDAYFLDVSGNAIGLHESA